MIYYFCQKCEHYHITTQQQLNFSRKHQKQINKVSKPSKTKTPSSPIKLIDTVKKTQYNSTVKKPYLTIYQRNNSQINSLTTSLIKDNKNEILDDHKIVGNKAKSREPSLNNNKDGNKLNDIDIDIDTENKPQKIKQCHMNDNRCFGFQCGFQAPLDSQQIPLRGHIGRKLHS